LIFCDYNHIIYGTRTGDIGEIYFESNPSEKKVENEFSFQSNIILDFFDKEIPIAS
jgi:hypothetical protein